MTPVTGASACAWATSGSASTAKNILARLPTAAPQLLQRNELVPFGADPVDELLEGRDPKLRADERRVPEKRGPGIPHHLVQARRLEHVVDMLRLAAVAGKRHIAEIFRPDVKAVIV